jgi:hypothetical protein
VKISEVTRRARSFPRPRPLNAYAIGPDLQPKAPASGPRSKVDVAGFNDGSIALFSVRNPGEILLYHAAEWLAFVAGAMAGEFRSTGNDQQPTAPLVRSVVEKSFGQFSFDHMGPAFARFAVELSQDQHLRRALSRMPPLWLTDEMWRDPAPLSRGKSVQQLVEDVWHRPQTRPHYLPLNSKVNPTNNFLPAAERNVLESLMVLPVTTTSPHLGHIQTGGASMNAFVEVADDPDALRKMALCFAFGLLCKSPLTSRLSVVVQSPDDIRGWVREIAYNPEAERFEDLLQTVGGRPMGQTEAYAAIHRLTNGKGLALPSQNPEVERIEVAAQPAVATPPTQSAHQPARAERTRRVFHQTPILRAPLTITNKKMTIENNGWASIVSNNGSSTLVFDPQEVVIWIAGVATGQFDFDPSPEGRIGDEYKSASLEEAVRLFIPLWLKPCDYLGERLQQFGQTLKHHPEVTQGYADLNRPLALDQHTWDVLRPAVERVWNDKNDARRPPEARQNNFLPAIETVMGMTVATTLRSNVVADHIGECNFHGSNLRTFVRPVDNVDGLLRVATAEAFGMLLPEPPDMFMSAAIAGPKGLLYRMAQPLSASQLRSQQFVQPETYIEDRHGLEAVLLNNDDPLLWSKGVFPESVRNALDSTVSMAGFAIPGQAPHPERGYPQLELTAEELRWMELPRSTRSSPSLT